MIAIVIEEQGKHWGVLGLSFSLFLFFVCLVLPSSVGSGREKGME
jgi:hypothetical protein